MNRLLSLSLLMLSIALTGAEQLKLTEGKWIAPDGGVQKLFTSLLGGVYQFPPTEYFELKADQKAGAKRPFSSLQVDLSPNLCRYIVLDFQIRLYPALSECRNPVLYFSITRSKNQAIGLKNSQFLNGLSLFNSNQKTFRPFETIYLSDALPQDREVQIPVYTPSYRPIHYRIIFDTGTDGFYSLNVNGQQVLLHHYERFPAKPIRSFGLILQHQSADSCDEKRRLLEISAPRIATTNNLNDLATLPEVTPFDDIYANFTVNLPKSPENPDEIYAQAMQQLQGDDLINGVELLKTAIKQNHIMAMYQLGVCFERGIGVEQNYKKALRYFNDAANFGLPEAIAQYPLTYWRATGTIKWTAERHDEAELKRLQAFNHNFPTMQVRENVLVSNLFGLGDINPLVPEVEDKLQVNSPVTFLAPGRALLAAGKPAEAEALFALGKDQGDLDCRMEWMLSRFRQNKLLPRDFNTLSDLDNSDHPLYEILKYAVKHPKDPGGLALANGNWSECVRLWREEGKPEQLFLLGLERLYQFFHYKGDVFLQRIVNQEINEVIEAWKYFDLAAEKNVPGAQYWAGKRRLDQDKSFYPIDDGPYRNGLVFMKNAAAAGFTPAILRVTQEEFNTFGRISESAEARLNSLCRSKNGKALYLKAEILLAEARRIGENSPAASSAVTILTQAAQAGIPAAHYQLGRCYYQGIGVTQDRQAASKHWKTFIELNNSLYWQIYRP